MKFVLLFAIILFLINTIIAEEEDYYKLLDVSRDATVKEIRKAFKSLAVKLHPDKNQEDPDADSKFVKLARAYEVLKDPDTRKHYDVHGDTEKTTDNNRQYHSYTYYRDHFGIYDDDPLIVTLSRADYEVNILDNNQAWFVNFYSPQCHHCHELAPTWRRLAAELEGVIRIAAVNCEDDWSLCYQLSIQSYPSLLYYEKESHLYEGEKFQGPRTFDRLKQYVLSKLTVRVEAVNGENWEHGLRKKQWLLFLCGDNLNCPEDETRLKLAAILEGLMSVGMIEDPELCTKIADNYKENPVIFWQINDELDESTTSTTIHTITGSDTKEIVNNILNLLPNPETITDEKFQQIRNELKTGPSTKPWLLCFYLGTATDLDLQLKRLPSKIPMVNIGLVHCGKSASLCASLHVARYPTWAVLKVGGAFELHHGRDVLHELISFAKESIKSTNLHALSPTEFHNIINAGSTWFIDWYAPWCPPCRKLMPELRRASMHFEPDKVQFGTVDCTMHRNLCSNQGITSYPTTVLYNGSQIHKFHGVPSEEGIVEFVSDMLNPIVINIDDKNFIELSTKSKEELWIVDYFAPWCGPCQRLSPEWRRLAKEMIEFPQVKVVQINCDTNSDICNEQNVRSYPTIRLYPLGSRGLNTVALYNGNRDVVSLKRWILTFLPSPVISMNSEEFKGQILTKKFLIPWLVEFYAPWCGHCTHFEPEFRKVAERLEGHIRSAKVDCEAERLFCSSLRITSYPTVFLYLSSTDRREIDSQNSKTIIKEIKTILDENLYKHDEL